MESTGTAVWFYRGTLLTYGSALSLNVGNAFLIECYGVGGAPTSGTLTPVFVVLGTRNTNNQAPTFSVTYNANLDSNGNSFSLDLYVSSSGGTIIYDSLLGPRSSYTHWIFSSAFYFRPCSVYCGSNDYLSRGRLYTLVPKILNSDSGTFYCAYVDGSNAFRSNIFYSTGVTITTSVKSVGSSLSRSGVNPIANYAVALLASAKSIF